MEDLLLTLTVREAHTLTARLLEALSPGHAADYVNLRVETSGLNPEVVTIDIDGGPGTTARLSSFYDR